MRSKPCGTENETFIVSRLFCSGLKCVPKLITSAERKRGTKQKRAMIRVLYKFLPVKRVVIICCAARKPWLCSVKTERMINVNEIF